MEIVGWVITESSECCFCKVNDSIFYTGYALLTLSGVSSFFVNVFSGRRDGEDGI